MLDIKKPFIRCDKKVQKPNYRVGGYYIGGLVTQRCRNKAAFKLAGKVFCKGCAKSYPTKDLEKI